MAVEPGPDHEPRDEQDPEGGSHRDKLLLAAGVVVLLVASWAVAMSGCFPRGC